MEDIMLDLKFVRENPEIVKQNIKNNYQQTLNTTYQNNNDNDNDFETPK